MRAAAAAAAAGGPVPGGGARAGQAAAERDPGRGPGLALRGAAGPATVPRLLPLPRGLRRARAGARRRRRRPALARGRHPGDVLHQAQLPGTLRSHLQRRLHHRAPLPTSRGAARQDCSAPSAATNRAAPRRHAQVAVLMGTCFLRLAKDLGYKCVRTARAPPPTRPALAHRCGERLGRALTATLACPAGCFTNTASIGLWERLGFTRLATVPSAARLKGYEVPTRPTWRGPQSAALARVVVHGCHGATDPAREKPSAQCADVRMPCGVQGELIDAYQYWIDLTKHDHTSYKPRSSLHMLSIRAARQYCVFAPYGLALALATAAALGLHRRRSRT
eukprot:scaffold487_cov344-Prasinococcus_capsulatus_cf.AAC.9